MNLTRALDVALPDIPARSISQRTPRLDPGTTFREHIEDGERVVRVYTPASGFMFKLTPEQWSLAQLFDGNRTYKEIAETYSARIGAIYDEQAVAEFGSDLRAANFWYETPQEKNVSLLLQSKEERRKNLKAKNRYSDLSIIIFPAFNPDRGLNWIYGHSRWIYSRWFTIFTVIAFGFTAGITLSHWGEIGRDTTLFYNFSNKSFGDILILYALGMFVVAVHEYAHAHACKHAGGRVPAMGFALFFLTPAFYTDTTEGAVMGTRSQRLVISLAGIWSELILCSIATPIWWLSAPDTVIHEGAYIMMMLTGIVSLVVNWNPLIKLDGYHMLCEIIGIAELKEDSTAWLSAWLKRYLWRLPVEVPYVLRRRRIPFAIYALLSGAYSYTILYVIARFAGNISRAFSPEWAFVPEYGVALLVFKSRIRLLVNFMKLVYLDKKDRVRAGFRTRGAYAISAAAIVLCLLPVWRHSVSGPFVLEPIRHSVVRAVVPGAVENVFVGEGATVAEGQLLAKLRNVPLSSAAAGARAQYVVAVGRARSAAMNYQDMGTALQTQKGLAAQSAQLRLETDELEIKSPLSGVVLTARPEDKIGMYLNEGTELLEIADLNRLRARVYISEYDLYKVHAGSPARLEVEGVPVVWQSQAASLSPASSNSDPALIDLTEFKGLNPPKYYLADLTVQSSEGRLKPGMTGVARIYGERMSLAGLGWENLKAVLGRKLW